MEALAVRDLSFCYPESDTDLLSNISFTVNSGEFITLCGVSGSGKTTLLRHLKPTLTPCGSKSGEIGLFGKDISSLTMREQAAKIGFVMQSPDSQLVTDKVWHELAFGLESLGLPNEIIRRRVAETADFFGLGKLFERDVNSLSGGQKQLLNLASVTAMQPDLLLLDEPTSQLDPIAAADFLGCVSKINRELGVTVIITEHRLEDVLPVSSRVLVLEQGRVISYDTPQNTGRNLKKANSRCFLSMPSYMQIWHAAETSEKSDCPVTIVQGREWLKRFADSHTTHELYPEPQYPQGDTVAQLKHVYFRYQKNFPDVLKDLSLTVRQGDFTAILGGNGVGKSTLLSLLGGTEQPYSGSVTRSVRTATMPQNPQAVLNGKTVYESLCDALDGEVSSSEMDKRIHHICQLLEIYSLLNRHPFDLSGGEQQKVAFAKLLLLNPQMILLDEPTKGLDAVGKQQLAGVLQSLTCAKVTVIMVSHDVEFCARYCHRCMLLFNGEIISEDPPRQFFVSNSFYVTAARRMSRGIIEDAVTADDVIYCCTGKKQEPSKPDLDINDFETPTYNSKEELSSKKYFPFWKKTTALIGAVLLIAGCLIDTEIISFPEFDSVPFLIKLSLIAVPLLLLIISTAAVSSKRSVGEYISKSKLPKRTAAAAFMIFLMIPITIFIGVVYLKDQKYLFISLLVLFECMIPFFLIFEGRKPQARELVIIAVLCAIAIAGRSAFFMLPQIKPVVALVILSGVTLGGETGFIVGSVTMLVSNIYFGQGAWTPWQMFAAGIIGFLSGVIFQKGLLQPTRAVLSVFGFIVAILIYGGVMNFSSLVLTHAPINYASLTAFYAQGLPMDIVHALSTAVILWFASDPMLEKMHRIKTKYQLL